MAAMTRWRAGAAQDVQIVRDDPESDPALHAGPSAIAAARQAMAPFEHADSPFASGSPSERPPEPAWPGLAPPARQDHSAHASSAGRLLTEAAAATDRRLPFLKLIVPKDLKREFLRKLRRMNITAHALFPGLDGLGRSVGELIQLGADYEEPE